jgi:glutamate--cysteine ligase
VPSPSPVLHPTQAGRIAADHAFVARPPSSERLVGIESEWLTVCLRDPQLPAVLEHVRAVASGVTLPCRSTLSYEPGGQVELSTVAAPGLDALDALATDGAALGGALAAAGIGIVAIGLEPGIRRARVVQSPRYDAMESYFDESGDAGRRMMRSTAAIQVNLDLGPPDEIDARWRLTHALGPVLAAAFANSPFADGAPTGWRSTRLAVWHEIDPTRTMPAANGVDCRQAWARYALDAEVMLVRRTPTDHVALPRGLTFAKWIEHGHPLGWPTAEDLEYHLGTLFPPVRPRGWLELRMVDALPTPWWRVAGAITATLVNDSDASARAAAATAGTAGLWDDAARHGLDHPDLAAAARECFAAAADALARADARTVTRDAVDEFVDRFVARGRCPADDLLDAWHRDGTLLPPLEYRPFEDLPLEHA